MADNDLSQEDYAKAVFEDGGSLVIDLSNIEGLKFEAIPKGIYPAVVDQCEYKMSKSSGHPMLEFIFEISEGEYNGRKLYFYASFSPKALSGTKTSLQRIEPTIFNGPFKPKEVAESGQLLGKPVRLKIKHQEYNGEMQAAIQQILAPSAAGEGVSNGDSFFS